MEFDPSDTKAYIRDGGDVTLTLENTDIGTTFTLENTLDNDESVTISPDVRGFAVELEQSEGENEGALSGTFAGDKAQGLLAAFRAIRNNEEGNIEEAIQGVKILKRQ
jgi:hypothetical protein